MKTDDEPKRDVERELECEPSIDASAIGVATTGGEAEAAENAAWATPGVAKVENRLAVTPV